MAGKVCMTGMVGIPDGLVSMFLFSRSQTSPKTIPLIEASRAQGFGLVFAATIKK